MDEERLELRSAVSWKNLLREDMMLILIIVCEFLDMMLILIIVLDFLKDVVWNKSKGQDLSNNRGT